MKGDMIVENWWDVTDVSLIKIAWRSKVARSNPFGICQRICDLNLENCGYCTEPLQCDEWRKFWIAIEQGWAEQFKRAVMYDPDAGCGGCGSSVCDDCNPGWDEWNWRDEEPWEEEDYGCDF
jgi:hypothetical protein